MNKMFKNLNLAKITDIKLLRKGKQVIYKLVVEDPYDTHILKLVKTGDQYVVTSRHFTDFELSAKCDYEIFLDSDQDIVFVGNKRQIPQMVNKVVDLLHSNRIWTILAKQADMLNYDEDDCWIVNDDFYRWAIQDIQNNEPEDHYKQAYLDKLVKERKALAQGKLYKISLCVAAGNFYGENYVMKSAYASSGIPRY